MIADLLKLSHEKLENIFRCIELESFIPELAVNFLIKIQCYVGTIFKWIIIIYI